MKILLIGGAGFLGSTLAQVLLEQGDEIVIVDNFTAGRREAIPAAATVYECDAGLMLSLEQVLQKHFLDLAIDLTAYDDAVASAHLPFHYYHNNFIAKLYLLQSLLRGRVKRFLMASTLEIFGQSTGRLLSEDERPIPSHALGKSLLAAEELLSDLARAEGLTYAIVRLGRLAGWDGTQRRGENLATAKTLPARIFQKILRKETELTLYRTELTNDKTVVRNYLHVSDAARFLAVLAHGFGHFPGGEIYHLAGNIELSELKIVAMAEQLYGVNFALTYEPLPSFIPPILLVDSTKISNNFHWRPQFDMAAIMNSLWLQIQGSQLH